MFSEYLWLVNMLERSQIEDPDYLILIAKWIYTNVEFHIDQKMSILVFNSCKSQLLKH